MKLKEKMYALVSAWESSGQKRADFLSDKDISLPKFDYWICKYRKKDQRQPSLRAQVAPAAFESFVLSDADAPDEIPRSSVSMEIITPSGTRITIYNWCLG